MLVSTAFLLPPDVVLCANGFCPFTLNNYMQQKFKQNTFKKKKTNKTLHAENKIKLFPLCHGCLWTSGFILLMLLYKEGYKSYKESGIRSGIRTIYAILCVEAEDKLCLGKLPVCKTLNFSPSYLGGNHP